MYGCILPDCMLPKRNITRYYLFVPLKFVIIIIIITVICICFYEMTSFELPAGENAAICCESREHYFSNKQCSLVHPICLSVSSNPDGHDRVALLSLEQDTSPYLLLSTHKYKWVPAMVEVVVGLIATAASKAAQSCIYSPGDLRKF